MEIPKVLSQEKLRLAYLASICGLSPEHISRVQDFEDDLGDVPSRGALHFARQRWEAYVSSCRPQAAEDNQ